MYAATLFYGRRGVVLNAISGVDLALWDLLGQVRQEPVYEMLGGAVRDELSFYATGPRPDLAEGMGFVGGKLPLHHGPAEGPAGLRANLELLERHAQCGRRRLLAVPRLLDVARRRLRHPARVTPASNSG